MRLRAERCGARSVLSRVERSAPFHPGPAHYHGADGRTPETVVQGVGPGIFPGDRLVAEVAVGRGAALVVRGQGAVKAYPSPTGAEARAETRLTVAEGGALWWLPGELIPFRGAVLRQETRAELAIGARLALLDLLTPGRLAMGERDAYARLDLRLRVERAGRPLLIERALLEPAARPIAGPGGFGSGSGGRGGGGGGGGSGGGGGGDFGCVGTLLLVGYEAPPLAPAVDPGGVWLGADGRDGWALVRALGPAADATRRALLGVLAVVADAP